MDSNEQMKMLGDLELRSDLEPFISNDPLARLGYELYRRNIINVDALVIGQGKALGNTSENTLTQGVFSPSGKTKFNKYLAKQKNIDENIEKPRVVYSTGRDESFRPRGRSMNTLAHELRHAAIYYLENEKGYKLPLENEEDLTSYLDAARVKDKNYFTKDIEADRTDKKAYEQKDKIEPVYEEVSSIADAELKNLQVPKERQQKKKEKSFLRELFNFNEGGVAMDKQMELFEDGGLKDEGGMIDEVSGNEVPPGSTREEVRDDIPAQLSEGEFVFPADVVRYWGLETLMKMRQEAKAGLQRMEEMGQMGNSEEATIPDDLPFDVNDLDMEDDGVLEYAQGGVVHAQAGTFIQPNLGLQQQPSQFTGYQPQYTPYTQLPMPTTTPVTTPPAFTPLSQQQTPVLPQMQIPTFTGLTGTAQPSPGGYDEMKTYVNSAGVEIQIPFKNGSPIYPVPEGYTLKTDAVSSAQTGTTTGATTPTSTVDYSPTTSEEDRTRLDATLPRDKNFGDFFKGLFNRTGQEEKAQSVTGEVTKGITGAIRDKSGQFLGFEPVRTLDDPFGGKQTSIWSTTNEFVQNSKEYRKAALRQGFSAMAFPLGVATGSYTPFLLQGIADITGKQSLGPNSKAVAGHQARVNILSGLGVVDVSQFSSQAMVDWVGKTMNAAMDAPGSITTAPTRASGAQMSTNEVITKALASPEMVSFARTSLSNLANDVLGQEAVSGMEFNNSMMALSNSLTGDIYDLVNSLDKARASFNDTVSIREQLEKREVAALAAEDILDGVISSPDVKNARYQDNLAELKQLHADGHISDRMYRDVTENNRSWIQVSAAVRAGRVNEQTAAVEQTSFTDDRIAQIQAQNIAERKAEKQTLRDQARQFGIDPSIVDQNVEQARLQIAQEKAKNEQAQRALQERMDQAQTAGERDYGEGDGRALSAPGTRDISTSFGASVGEGLGYGFLNEGGVINKDKLAKQMEKSGLSPKK